MKNRYRTVLVFLLAAVLLAACKKGYESPLQGKAYEDISFTEYAGTRDIVFRGQDLSSIRMTTSDNSWCNAYILADTMRIAVLPNTTYDDRTATITAYDREDGTSVAFSVSQKYRNAIFSDKVSYDIPEEGQVLDIGISSNCQYEVDIPASATWITLDREGTRGLVDTNVRLVIAPNDTRQAREAVVGIRDVASGLTNEIAIRQAATLYMYISSDLIVAGAAGGEYEIEVNTNVVGYTFAAGRDEYWLSEGTRTETSQFHYTQRIVVAPLHESIPQRRGYIYLEGINNGPLQMITVEQRHE